MNHTRTKQPPRYGQFYAYTILMIDPSWVICEWSPSQKCYVDAVLKKDIPEDFYWVSDLPTPEAIRSAQSILAGYPELYHQIHSLLKQIFI